MANLHSLIIQMIKVYRDDIELKTQNKQKIQRKAKHEKLVFKKVGRKCRLM